MDRLPSTTAEPDLRQLCGLMVRPAFELARARPDFRRYVKAFGHQLALIETSAASVADFFIEGLTDALVGLLNAQETETGREE